MSSLRIAKPMTCPPLPAESKRQWAEGHPKADSRKRIAGNRTLPAVWLSPVEMPLLLQTSIFFSQHYAIPKGRLPSKGALAIPAMLLFLFANRSLLCLYGHFPFYSYYFSIILNPFPVPTPQKPAGSLQTWEKSRAPLFACPSPFRRWVAGRKGAISSQPQAGIWQPIADRRTLSAWRLISLSPFRHFEGNREISHAQFHHRK